jgi:hypothetical protein
MDSCMRYCVSGMVSFYSASLMFVRRCQENFGIDAITSYLKITFERYPIYDPRIDDVK